MFHFYGYIRHNLASGSQNGLSSRFVSFFFLFFLLLFGSVLCLFSKCFFFPLSRCNPNPMLCSRIHQFDELFQAIHLLVLCFFREFDAEQWVFFGFISDQMHHTSHTLYGSDIQSKFFLYFIIPDVSTKTKMNVFVCRCFGSTFVCVHVSSCVGCAIIWALRDFWARTLRYFPFRNALCAVVNWVWRF